MPLTTGPLSATEPSPRAISSAACTTNIVEYSFRKGQAPPDATHLKVESVAVAWKNTREARRAVADALPFLQKANTVSVVEICASKSAESAATSRLEDVANYLLRHGIKSTTHVKTEEKGANAAHRLLDFAAHEHVDLIVAGAYGHSRYQEWVFGGFTEALLTQTARAVFFSH